MSKSSTPKACSTNLRVGSDCIRTDLNGARLATFQDNRIEDMKQHLQRLCKEAANAPPSPEEDFIGMQLPCYRYKQ
jgi:hypothetical protein